MAEVPLAVFDRLASSSDPIIVYMATICLINLYCDNCYRKASSIKAGVEFNPPFNAEISSVVMNLTRLLNKQSGLCYNYRAELPLKICEFIAVDDQILSSFHEHGIVEILSNVFLEAVRVPGQEAISENALLALANVCRTEDIRLQLAQKKDMVVHVVNLLQPICCMRVFKMYFSIYSSIAMSFSRNCFGFALD
jgi:hypothetical protein